MRGRAEREAGGGSKRFRKRGANRPGVACFQTKDCRAGADGSEGAWEAEEAGRSAKGWSAHRVGTRPPRCSRLASRGSVFNSEGGTARLSLVTAQAMPYVRSRKSRAARNTCVQAISPAPPCASPRPRDPCSGTPGPAR